MRLGIQAQYAGVKRPRQIAATSALTSAVTRFGVPLRRPDVCARGAPFLNGIPHYFSTRHGSSPARTSRTSRQSGDWRQTSVTRVSPTGALGDVGETPG